MHKRIWAGAEITRREIKTYKRWKFVHHGNPVHDGTKVHPAHVEVFKGR